MESSPLPVIVRPAQEYFTYMTDYLLFFRPAQEFLDVYHATPAFFRSHSKYLPIQSPITTH
jgi:hypothetical protein